MMPDERWQMTRRIGHVVRIFLLNNGSTMRPIL